ncbi:MAG TPA: hypothetical protein VM408_03375 [Methylomirabilota bacterium]|nr:hypothetical protein [Methylomirabilota bacterium]
MATEQDAARDRVLAARSELAGQVDLLEASARAAVDIPAKIKRSPAKAAGLVGGVAFLALKGPQRVFRFAREKVRGEPDPLPKRLLPDEVEKTLRKLGNDGDKVRGTLERDFAEYAKKSAKDRQAVGSVLLLALGRPIAARAARTIGDAIFSPDAQDFSKRLAEVRERAGQGASRVHDEAEHAGETAKQRLASVRRDEGGKPGNPTVAGPGPADETAPTGI